MKKFSMETAKLPKFNWNEVSELNSGHTSSIEWGIPVRKSTIKNLVSYKVSWETQD